MKKNSISRFKIGQFARSKQGRDKNRLYVIINTDKRFIYVANGDKWTVNNPKKKNPFHLQVINQKIEHEAISNARIKQEIQNFSQYNHEEDK